MRLYAYLFSLTHENYADKKEKTPLHT